MQNQQTENLSVSTIVDPKVYAGASMLNLSETERKNLMAPFDDLDYEIRPDGFIYLPQTLNLKRLNDVIGVGQWSLLLINTGNEEVKPDLFKVFYDGALMIRGGFVSRSCGEAQYSRRNQNQSWASALEAAKSDCRVRCCKDLGIDSDSRNPSFIRRWQKAFGIRVLVRDDQGKTSVVWRRSDIDPFWNEVGPAPTGPTHPSQVNQQGNELPWLNAGPDYDKALNDLIAAVTTITKLRQSYRIGKKTEGDLVQAVLTAWKAKVDECKDMKALPALYNAHEAFVKSFPGLLDVFTARREQLQPTKA